MLVFVLIVFTLTFTYLIFDLSNENTKLKQELIELNKNSKESLEFIKNCFSDYKDEERKKVNKLEEEITQLRRLQFVSSEDDDEVRILH